MRTAPTIADVSSAQLSRDYAVKRVRLGRIYAHQTTSAEALESVVELVAARRGGYIVTPNVDHVVQCERNEQLCAAYRDASLSLVDGQPLVWLSKLMGEPFPEKISGSDFVPQLVHLAAQLGWRVFFLGGAEGVAAKAAEVLNAQYPSLQVGVYSPAFGFENDPVESAKAFRAVREFEPHIVVVALGCPKQELLMHRWEHDLAPALCIGAGATLDFIAGTTRRAPAWMSRAGLEWLHRLAHNPRKLAYRYLVRGPRIIGIAWRMLRLPREARVFREAPTRDIAH